MCSVCEGTYYPDVNKSEDIKDGVIDVSVGAASELLQMDELDLYRIKKEGKLGHSAMVAACLKLEKTRMQLIEQMIPGYENLKHDCKSSEGMTRSYAKYFFPGVSFSHAVLAWNYDTLKFNCLAPSKTESPNLSDDLKHKLDDPMSLHHWFKQLGDRKEFTYKYHDYPSEPVSYLLKNFERTEVPKPSEFENWPLEHHTFDEEFATVPKNPFMFQPRRVISKEKNIDYFVSPRMFIRFIGIRFGGDHPLLDPEHFRVDSVQIFREVGGIWDPNQEHGVQMEVRTRMIIVKHFMLEYFLFKNFEG